MESKKIAKQILIATAVLTSFLGSNLVYADVVQSNSNNRASTETARVTALARLESGKSIKRYFPPNGKLATGRWSVNVDIL